MLKSILLFVSFFLTTYAWGQKKYYSTDRIRFPDDPYISKQGSDANFSVSGMMEISYEHYGLDVKPDTFRGMRQRKPWNQVRFNFQPTLKFGKDWSIPLNFSFPLFSTNFAGPYAGIGGAFGGIGKQSFKQWLSNPANNLGISPKYKWAQLLLGTQYIKYSDLSTGDVGIFGAGFDLRPKGFLLKFFTGTSQQGINYIAPPPLPGVSGAYKRSHYMFQLGKEKEGKYLIALNFSKGKDDTTSIISRPVTINPEEGFASSLVTDVKFLKMWYVKLEAAQSYFTKDVTQPADTVGDASLKPFISGHTSTVKDNAGIFSFGMKTDDFDIGYTTKYLGKNFRTTGYPYMQPDHWDNTIDTRFNTWKRKINVVASVGIRTNNINDTLLKSNQFIGNLNWFTQFTDNFSLNVSYNNFGFNSVSGTNPYGIKNVSNDFGISPTYTLTREKMMHIFTLSYNYSKYDERDAFSGTTTSNNTHTGLFSYIPTFFNSDLTPDISIMYFLNTMPLLKMQLTTLSAGAGYPLFKKKLQLKGQVQYTLGQLNSYSNNKNLIASLGIDYKITKKLTWKNFFSTNRYKYGDELMPAYPDGVRYLETNIRTTIQYKF